MLIVLATTCALVLLVVGVHYNTLVRLSTFLEKRKKHVRRWVAVSVLGMLLAHVVEVLFFALGYMFLQWFGDFGELRGELMEASSDYWYFSFVAYTSLGFGDIVPFGDLRFLTAIETLTGLILIAWSASFLFVQMQRLWAGDDS